MWQFLNRNRDLILRCMLFLIFTILFAVCVGKAIAYAEVVIPIIFLVGILSYSVSIEQKQKDFEKRTNELEQLKTVLFLALRDVGQRVGLCAPSSPSEILTVGGLAHDRGAWYATFSISKEDFTRLELDKVRYVLQGALDTHAPLAACGFPRVYVGGEAFPAMMLDDAVDFEAYLQVKLFFTNEDYINQRKAADRERREKKYEVPPDSAL